VTPDGKICVLLVDDDVNVRKSVSIGLTVLGFDVAMAKNGIQALALLTRDYLPESALLPGATYDADVILLDLLMPIMDGYEFLEQYPGPVPVVVMSGLGEIAGLPRHPFALVVKPMSMHEIAPTLREAAQSWRTQGDAPK